MMALLCILLGQTAVGHPYPAVAELAKERLRQARFLFSDEAELYRWTWSASVAGPCPRLVVGPGGEDEEKWLVPCSVWPFVPDPTKPPMPATLLTAYQHVTYTAPRSAERPKASLAMAWRFELIGPGLIWTLTVNAEGIQQEILLCGYDRFSKIIPITPTIWIEVDFLRPSRYYHLQIKPTGDHNLQIHEIERWSLPFSVLGMVQLYDQQPNRPRCGTPSILYTSKPAEVLMDLFGAFGEDIAEIKNGDRQIVVTPMLGTRDCGEFAYVPFYQFMTHRRPATPSNGADGPPLEIWSFSDKNRDPSESTRRATDPDADPGHGRIRDVKNSLQDAGLQGPINTDPDMARALVAQAEQEQQRFKRGTELGDQVLSLMEMLTANPGNTQLRELFHRFVEPHLGDIDHLHDTEIEFDPTIHCTRPDATPHQLPFLGQHFFDDPLSPCRFCGYHDRIVGDPFQSWAHTRLLDVAWVWNPIHHPGTGNLYEQAFRLIQETLSGPGNLTDLQNEMGRRQVSETHQNQVAAITLADLEDEPSGVTPNRTRSAPGDDLPPFFQRPYNPCADPSWTIEYLFLFGEIQDIGQAPCPLLWGVGF